MDRRISDVAPIVCTLDARDFKERLDWIANLNARALLEARRDDMRLELTYQPDAFEEVGELVYREQRCCPFLQFDLNVDAAAVRLIVTAPEEARQAAELVFEPFLSKSANASPGSCGWKPGCAQ